MAPSIIRSAHKRWPGAAPSIDRQCQGVCELLHTSAIVGNPGPHAAPPKNGGYRPIEPVPRDVANGKYGGKGPTLLSTHTRVRNGARRVIPTPEVERRHPVQLADLGRDARQWARCAVSGRLLK